MPRQTWLMRGKANRVTASSAQKYASNAASKTRSARVAVRGSEAEIDEGTFLICSEKGNQHAEGKSSRDLPRVRAQCEHMLCVRQFQLKVEKKEDHGVNGQEKEDGKVNGLPLPNRQAGNLLPSAAK